MNGRCRCCRWGQVSAGQVPGGARSLVGPGMVLSAGPASASAVSGQVDCVRIGPRRLKKPGWS